jgi:hypothetical protein
VAASMKMRWRVIGVYGTASKRELPA